MQNKKSKIINLKVDISNENEKNQKTNLEIKLKSARTNHNLKSSKLKSNFFSSFRFIKSLKNLFSPKYLGIVGVSVILIFGFVYFNSFNKKSLEIPKILILKTSSGNEVEIDNKFSLHLPFVKNEGQIAKEVKYYTSIFSGNLYVTDDSLTYKIDINEKSDSKLAETNFEEEKIQEEIDKNAKSIDGVESVEKEKQESVEIKEEIKEKSEIEKDDKNSKIKSSNNQIVLKENFLNYKKEKISFLAQGQNKSKTTTSYFKGDESDKWKADVETNDSIHLGELYNRIDVHLRAYANNVEKIFLVESGGNPDEIQIQLDGVDAVSISEKGELVLDINDQKLALTKPVAYQEITENEQKIKKYIITNYSLKENNSYGFKVGNYDHNLPLIIDPLLSSTFLGGTADEMYSYDDFGGRIFNGHKSVAEDASGNIFVIGHSKSDDYPTTLGVIDETYNDSSSTLKNDIVISKFNSDLTQLLASTYLGGTSEDIASSLVIDGNNLYITGFTRSNDFPTTSGVHDTTFNGGNSDVFVSKLNTDLTTLNASSYIGGNDKEFAYSIIKDGTNLYLAGDTYSSNFPSRAGAYDATLGGNNDGFILRINESLTTIDKTTLVGGSGNDFARQIAKIGANLVVVGQTSTPDFPLASNSFSGLTDGFIASFNADLSTLSKSTYLGGSQTDLVSAMEVDSAGNILVVGSSDSTNFAGMTGYKTNNTGHFDGFIAKLNSSLNQVGGTYIGGNNQDDIYEISLDSADNVYVVGQTYSANLPTTQYAWDRVLSGTSDGFISKFNSDLTTLNASTFLGGAGSVDYILSVIITNDADENLVLKGFTNSADFPVTTGAYDSSLNGSRDIFVSKISNDLRQNAWPDHTEVRYENPAETYNTSLNALTGETKVLTIILKDPFGNIVTEDSYDGNYTVVLSGASVSPHNHLPTCTNNVGTPINFGVNTTMTFTNGKATCNAVFYAAEVASVDARVTISAVNYDSTGNTGYDLDLNIEHSAISAVGSSINAELNPTIVEGNVNLTLTVNDAWGNPASLDGAAQLVTMNVAGVNTAIPTVTDVGNGTYTATYTTGQTAGTDLITATLNSVAVAWDQDGTPNGTFNLPLFSQPIHHFVLRYENPVNTFNSSLNATAGTAYTLAIMAKDQYGNNVNTYDGWKSITLTGANNSPYGNVPTCGGSVSYLGIPTGYSFTDGVAKCNLILYNAETIQLEGTDGTYNTLGDNAYDLDVVAINATHNHMKITDASGNNTISDAAGTTRQIKVSARDIYGNKIATYTGNHNITFSGAGISYNGTIPTVKNSSATPINFGAVTALTFASGEATTDMNLYKREIVDIDVVDDTAHNSTGSVNYDLGVTESSKGIVTASQSTIAVSQNPAGDCGEEGIIVTARDDYGNQLETGGHTVTLTITGTNPNNFTTPTTITDNNNGTFVATYNPTAGSDQITGTINTVAIGKDLDGTSDGTFNLTIIGGGGNTRRWDGSASVDWANPANWVEGIVPSACSTVIIDGNIEALGTFFQPTLSLAGGSVGIANLYLGNKYEADPDSTATTLTVSFGSETNKLLVSGDVIIGDTASTAINGTLTHTANNTIQEHVLNLEVGGTLTVEDWGVVDVTGKGYKGSYNPSGHVVNGNASHGGVGSGNSNDTVYGSITKPFTIGTGKDPAVRGGGAMKIVADNIQLGGNLLANGEYSANPAGGSVWLDTNALSGNGNIEARCQYLDRYGGGGRIAVYYTDDNVFSDSSPDFTGQIDTNWSLDVNDNRGGAGTIYLKDKNDFNDFGTLIVDNHRTSTNVNKTPQWASLMDISNKEMTFSKIDIRGGGILEVPTGATLNILDTTLNSGDKTGELQNRGTVNFKEESTGNPLADYSFANSFTFNQDAKNGVVTGLQGTLTIDNAGLSTFNTTGNDGILAAHAWSLPGNLSVINGGIVTHEVNPLNSNNQSNSLNLDIAGNLTVDATSKIDVSKKGFYAYYSSNYGPGAGPIYAGEQFNGNKNVYGSIKEPVDLGSLGYTGYKTHAASGGAAKIMVGNNADIQGEFLANSGHSGGSIWLDVDGILSGSATTLFSSSSNKSATGLSGGRTAIYYGSLNFSGTTLEEQVESYGGFIQTGTYTRAIFGAGTIYLKNKTSGEDKLIIDNNNFNNGYIDPFGKSITPAYNEGLMLATDKEQTYDHIEIKGLATYEVPEDATLNILDTTINTGDKTGELRNSGTVNFKEESTGNPLADYTFSDSFIFNQDAKNGVITGLQGTLTIDNAGLSTFNTTGNDGTLAAHAWNLPGNLNVINGGIVTHLKNNRGSGDQINSLNLNVSGNLTIDANSKIDVTGKGYNQINSSGFWFGGNGPGDDGGNAVYAGFEYGGNEQVYGSIKEPVDLGSASSSSTYTLQYIGGGSAKIFVNGDANILGEVLTNSSSYNASNGIIGQSSVSSGGSIWLDIDGELSGDTATTLISSSAKKSNPTASTGGRTAIYYGSLDFGAGNLEDVLESFGGTNYGAGTIYLKDKTSGENKLIIDNNNYAGYTTPQHAYLMTEGQTSTFSSVEIKGGGKYEIGTDDTLNLPTTANILGDATGQLVNRGLTTFTDLNTVLDGTIDVYNYGTLSGVDEFTFTNGSDLTHSAIGNLGTSITIGNGSIFELQDFTIFSPLELEDLTIQNGGTMTHAANSTAQTHIINLLADNLTVEAGGKIDLTAKGYAAQKGPGASVGGAGGSYGGTGGGVSGSTYGAETNPVDIGSGGSAGLGGGMIKAQVWDTLTVDGEIHADGEDNSSGAGAGGSILLTTDNFKGTGIMTADGGVDSLAEDGGGGRIAIFYQDVNIAGDHFLLPGNGSITHLDANPITMIDNDPVGGDDPTNLTKQGTLYLGFPDHYEITGTATQEAGTTQNINVTLTDNNGNPFIITADKNFAFSGANPSPTGAEPTIDDEFGNPIVLGNNTPLSLVNGTSFTDMTLYKAEEAEIETTDSFFDTFADQSYDLDVVVTESTPDETQTTIDTLINPVQFGNNVDIVVTPHDLYGNPIKTIGSTVILSVTGANNFGSLATTEVVDGLTGFVTYTASYLASNSGEDEITGTINSNTIIYDEDGTSDGIFHEFITFNSANHLEITGSANQIAGSPQTITITAKDSLGSIDFSYTGLKNITITGANNAPDGTKPTTRNNGGVDISMTESPSQVVELDFVNGVATSQMYLYKQETAEIEATDGMINTFADQSYDLDVVVTNSGIDYAESLLQVNKSAVEPSEEVIISVITRDEFQNQLTIGGETVSVSISGDNPVALISLNDNGDGTYYTTSSPLTHHIPVIEGTDLITAIVSGNAVLHDNDGVDNGTFNLQISTLPRHLEITGSNTQVAGASQTITLTVKKSDGNVDADYDGNKIITFSGASISNQGDIPIVDTINFGNGVTINFVDGVATASMTLFKEETAEIEATDGLITTTADQNYDLDVLVTEDDACLGTLSASPNPAQVNNQINIILNNVADQYGNAISVGGDNPSLNITGVNSTILTAVDNSNGTYSSYYTPTNSGTDILSGTLGVCNLNTVNIQVTFSVPPVCGSSAKIYLFNETNFTGDLCQTGNSNPTNPVFPVQGGNTSWNCENDGLSVGCSASREESEEENEKTVDLYKIKDISCNSLDLRVELKNFSNNDKFDFKVYIKNLSDDKESILKLKSTKISNNNKVTIHIDNLNEDTTYEFKVSASEEDKSDYIDSNKKETETLICIESSEKAECGSNAKTYKNTETEYVGNFCLRGEVDNIPTFPQENSSISWTCNYQSSSVVCKAKKGNLTEENSICGNGKIEENEDCDDSNIENEDGCDSSCKKEVITANSLVPVCGNASKNYSNIETSFDGDFCQVGNSNPINPTFPSSGNSTSWSCENDGLIVNCGAGRDNNPLFPNQIVNEGEKNNIETGNENNTENKNQSKFPILPWLSVLGLISAGLLMIPFRTAPPLSLGELFGLLTKGSKEIKWGTVFEEKTKIPIVAAKITLIDKLGVGLETVYSDKQGRFGFLAEPGTYLMNVYKKDYTLITASDRDPVYGELYINKPFTIKNKEEIVIKNIAMRSDKFDWKMYSETRIKAYTSAFRTMKTYLFLIIHIIAFIYTTIVTYLFPNKWNIVMFSGYIAIYVIQLFINKKKYGTINTADKKPVPFGIVSLHNKVNQRKESFAISDVIGRYYLLTENGDYFLRVKGQPVGGEIFEKQGNIKVTDGIVRKKIRI